MIWRESPDGYVTDEGYVILGKKHTTHTMKLCRPRDTVGPIASGNELKNLQIIAEAHMMARWVLNFTTHLNPEAVGRMTKGDEERLMVCKESAKTFLFLNANVKDT